MPITPGSRADATNATSPPIVFDLSSPRYARSMGPAPLGENVANVRNSVAGTPLPQASLPSVRARSEDIARVTRVLGHTLVLGGRPLPIAAQPSTGQSLQNRAAVEVRVTGNHAATVSLTEQAPPQAIENSERSIANEILHISTLGSPQLSESQFKLLQKMIRDDWRSNIENFIDASRTGDMLTAKKFLEAGGDVNARGQNGDTALLAAASRGNVSMIKYLLERNADVNAKASDGDTALLRAIARPRPNPDVVGQLISHSDIDVNAKDTGGNTPVMLAAQIGNLEIFDLLRTHPNTDIMLANSLGCGVLHKAAGGSSLCTSFYRQDLRHGYRPTGNQAKIIERLADSSENIINLKDKDGKTPLHYAVESGEADCIAALLKFKRINARQRSESGDAPLDLAARFGRLDVVNKLIDFHNPEFETSKLEIRRAVTSAVYGKEKYSTLRYTHRPVIFALSKHQNFDINARDPRNNDRTFLHDAADVGDEALVEFALSFPGIDVNVQDSEGDTPLHDAVSNKHHKVFEILRRTPGLNDQIKNEAGKLADQISLFRR